MHMHALYILTFLLHQTISNLATNFKGAFWYYHSGVRCRMAFIGLKIKNLYEYSSPSLWFKISFAIIHSIGTIVNNIFLWDVIIWLHMQLYSLKKNLTSTCYFQYGLHVNRILIKIMFMCSFLLMLCHKYYLKHALLCIPNEYPWFLLYIELLQ